LIVAQKVLARDAVAVAEAQQAANLTAVAGYVNQLVPQMDFSNMTRNISILVEASKILKVPVMVTEQYPQGLQKIVAEITAILGDHQLFEKSCFSCCQLEDFMKGLENLGRKQIMVTGIEAHVCVNQTAHDLLEAGYQVHLIMDAVASRFPKNQEVGVKKIL
jgi:nicotinamidase-related amidase